MSNAEIEMKSVTPMLSNIVNKITKAKSSISDARENALELKNQMESNLSELEDELNNLESIEDDLNALCNAMMMFGSEN